MHKRGLLQFLFLILVVAVVLVVPTLAAMPSAAGETATSTATSLAIPRGSASETAAVHINEIMFRPDAGNYEWVEIKNSGSGAVHLDGYGVTDEDGNWYYIPSALPDVPAGAFVVIVFDGAGAGSDDYNFGDGVATLHPDLDLIHIFEDDADQVALYTPLGTLSYPLYLPVGGAEFEPWNPYVPGPPADFPAAPLTSFVAWGADPAGDESSAVDAGIWGSGTYLGTDPMPGADPMLADGSLALDRDQFTSSVDNWLIYRPEETTAGSTNLSPAPFFRNPPDGIVTDDHQMTFGWSIREDAVSYQLDVDNNSDFSSPEVSVVVMDSYYQPETPFADGTYYFRVKVNLPGGAASGYSPTSQVTFITTDSALYAAAPAVVLGVVPQVQHKDTRMLDLDGSPETGMGRWDSAHETDGDWTVGNGGALRVNALDNMYCTRASISMIVAYHGGSLSQDRIAFRGYGGSAPEGDLGHGVGMWPNQGGSWGSGDNIFNWAMNDNTVTSSRGKPTFDQIKSWIDAGRPMLVVENNDAHSVVLDGYLDLIIGELAHRVDPWTGSGSWVYYNSWNISEYHVPPTGVTPRSDEDLDYDLIPDTIDDSDGDGVVDFDELNRFGLNPSDPDSDDDLVEDKADIREYVFDDAGGYSLRTADLDGDGWRKEVDPDNDYATNDGSMDGCEDSNHDGIYDFMDGETDNFWPGDDEMLHVQLRWPLLDSDVDIHLIRPGGVMWSYDDVYYGNTNPDWGQVGVTCDDPTLDIDCIYGCTVENIRLSSLENGTYQIKVHYYSDHDLGPTSPTVTVWFNGSRYDYGPQLLTDEQVWDVATVTWPTLTVTPDNSVQLTSPPAGSASLPAK